MGPRNHEISLGNYPYWSYSQAEPVALTVSFFFSIEHRTQRVGKNLDGGQFVTISRLCSYKLLLVVFPKSNLVGLQKKMVSTVFVH